MKAGFDLCKSEYIGYIDADLQTSPSDFHVLLEYVPEFDLVTGYRSKRRDSIEAATVAGDILKVLSSIVKIEDEQIVTHQGISPYVWVENISITGEA